MAKQKQLDSIQEKYLRKMKNKKKRDNSEMFQLNQVPLMKKNHAVIRFKNEG